MSNKKPNLLQIFHCLHISFASSVGTHVNTQGSRPRSHVLRRIKRWHPGAYPWVCPLSEEKMNPYNREQSLPVWWIQRVLLSNKEIYSHLSQIVTSLVSVLSGNYFTETNSTTKFVIWFLSYLEFEIVLRIEILLCVCFCIHIWIIRKGVCFND